MGERQVVTHQDMQAGQHQCVKGGRNPAADTGPDAVHGIEHILGDDVGEEVLLIENVEGDEPVLAGEVDVPKAFLRLLAVEKPVLQEKSRGIIGQIGMRINDGHREAMFNTLCCH